MLVSIPLTDDERAAVEDGQTALDTLLTRLADVTTPSGTTPRQIRAISRSLRVTIITLGSHELESPHPVAADPFCSFLDGVRVLEAE